MFVILACILYIIYRSIGKAKITKTTEPVYMQGPNPTEPEEFCMKGFDTKDETISENSQTEEKTKVLVTS